MNDILVIMLARSVGGIERRIATLYQYMATREPKFTVTFLVNRAQLDLLRGYDVKPTDKRVSLVKFGLPHTEKILDGKAVWYIVDYLCLILTLLLRFRNKIFHAAYFTKLSSLPFRKLVRANSKAFAFVDSQNPWRIMGSKRFKRILDESFKIDCLSEELRAQVLEFCMANKDQVFAAPCSFIDYSKTGIDKKKNVITFVGRFHDGKGLDILLPALPAVLERHGDVEIRLFGHGRLRKQTVRFIKEHGLRNVKVAYSHEPVNDLKESLIFLSLQAKENYPSQSLIEAMACGNAIIATDVGQTRKIVNEDVGILIKKEPQELVDAIDHLLNNQSLTREMGLKAREKVIYEHTVENYLSYLIENFFS